MEAYLDAIYYKNNPHKMPRARPVPEPVYQPVENIEPVSKISKDINDDDEDIQDIINKIINKKPSVKKTRELLKKYVELKEDEYDSDY